MTTHHIDGPYFEDFERGQEFAAPAVTLTEGHAAWYQALTGDRMRLPLDRELAAAVTGQPRAFAHPMLVINVVNGQTTYASQHVKGNLFYRGLLLQRPAFIGDTLTTTTRVVGLKQNKPKAGRAATGMVALQMRTVDQTGECILEYWRCPMIPCRDGEADTGRDDDFNWIPAALDEGALRGALPGHWRVEAMAPERYNVPAPTLEVGDRVIVEARDTVTCAPELVRMTGNIAFAHTDASSSYLGRRLVYGGHTISLAMAQVSRAMPNIVTLLGWQGCDHLGPVLEEDIVRSELEVTAKSAVPQGGSLYELRVDAFARRPGKDGDYEENRVLEWRLVLWSV